MQTRRRDETRRDEVQLDAETHVNVLSQQVVRRLVLLDRIVVDGAAGHGATEEEAEQPACTGYVIPQRSVICARWKGTRRDV